MERMQLLAAYSTACARAANLNGNGYLDLILGGMTPSKDEPHDSFAYIYWNGPDGLCEDRKTLLPANHINAMSVADFNNDGTPDLFVCSYADGRVRDLDSYIYWNRKGRGFSATDRTRLFTHSASGCVAADFNEDGWVDIAVANHKVWGDQVAYWRCGGTAPTASQTARRRSFQVPGLTACRPSVPPTSQTAVPRSSTRPSPSSCPRESGSPECHGRRTFRQSPGSSYRSGLPRPGTACRGRRGQARTGGAAGSKAALRRRSWGGVDGSNTGWPSGPSTAAARRG